MEKSNNILLEVKNLKMYFSVFKGIIRRIKIGENKAVDGISFHIKQGETFGLVGESGCGKTTTGRCIIQLCRPISGEVFFYNADLCKLKGNDLRRMRRKLQFIFQDPYSSLNPRMKAGNIVGEPLRIHNLVTRKKYRQNVEDLMEIVGLNPSMMDRYAHEFSGGQRQRIGIARALAVRPKFIIFDEPISALDVSIQAQIINLLEDLQSKFNLTYLFIAHDLAVVRHISDRVAVMYMGKIVEVASRADLYENPLHPYTKALLSSVPVPDVSVEAQRGHIILPGEVPSPLDPPAGCRFHPRCSYKMDLCVNEEPILRNLENGHQVACFLNQ
jgi:oligopeptide transport system ATP-binding protein